MPLVVDDKGKQTVSSSTGKVVNRSSSTPKTNQLVPDVKLNSKAKLEDDTAANSVKIHPTSSTRRSVSPQTGFQSVPKTPSMASPQTGFQSAPWVSLTQKQKEEKAPLSYGSSSESNESYEDYFRQAGMADEDIEDINNRGSWIQELVSAPRETPVVDELGYPVNMLGESTSQMPEQVSFVDDGNTFDYNHLTADRVTGTAMQNYGELGMGGRDWWEYDPYGLYTKSDEQQDYGFTPYLPDETSRVNMAASQILDAPSDLAGALGSIREAITDYNINYNNGKENGIDISGSDWDYRATPYINNMRRLIAQDPRMFLRMPEGGEIHGAPIETSVREWVIPDSDGNTRYAYGNVDNASYDILLTYEDGTTLPIPEREYSNWIDEEGTINIPEEYNNGYLTDTSFDNRVRLTFSDGQDILIPGDLVNENGDIDLDSAYVSIEDARGFVPEDLDALNAEAFENGDYYASPVRYNPYLVMDDGTKISYDQALDIYYDQEAADNPDNNRDDNISYDLDAHSIQPFLLNQMFPDANIDIPLPISIPNLAKPRRLSGEILQDGSLNWEDMLNNAIDFTAGSIPISMRTTAWPLSITQGLSKSLAGVDPNKYDPLTGSDKYIASEVDDSGNMSPTYSAQDQFFNTAGSMLVPFTEEIAGPIGGSSALEKLSGELPLNPTVGQVIKNFGIGAVGEGLEEIVGNLFEELTSNGMSAFGDYVTPSGERLFDDNGNPVVDEDGNYKYTDADGNPYEYMTDESGHVYRDQNTPLDRRIRNFFNPEDLANAFLGGVLVDATMQGAPTLGSIKRAAGTGKVLKNTGVNQYIDTERDRLRADNPYMDPAQGDVEIDPEFIKRLRELDGKTDDGEIKAYEE